MVLSHAGKCEEPGKLITGLKVTWGCHPCFCRDHGVDSSAGCYSHFYYQLLLFLYARCCSSIFYVSVHFILSAALVLDVIVVPFYSKAKKCQLTQPGLYSWSPNSNPDHLAILPSNIAWGKCSSRLGQILSELKEAFSAGFLPWE